MTERSPERLGEGGNREQSDGALSQETPGGEAGPNLLSLSAPSIPLLSRCAGLDQ